MKIVLGIVIILVIAIIGILIVAMQKPDHFRMERRIAINAAPEKIYPLIANLHNFILWSPFEHDPKMKRTFSGPDEGAGAVYEFDGNSRVGAGRITITEATPASEVVMKLEFFRPLQTINRVTFTLTPKDGATEVLWAMEGPNPMMAKIMQTIMNMEKSLGGEFEKGLTSLKALAEK
jgi:hypothetical protein